MNKTDKSPFRRGADILGMKKIMHEISMCIVYQMLISAKEKNKADEELGHVPVGW